MLATSAAIIAIPVDAAIAAPPGKATKNKKMASKTTVMVRVIHAHNNNSNVDPRLKGVQRQLKFLRFTGFKLLDTYPSHLSVGGESILLSSHNVPAEDPGTDFEIIVERRCHFRLVLTEENQEPLHFDVLDGRGERMQIAATGGGPYVTMARRSVSDGRSQVLTVGESAATLVLLRWNDSQWVELDRLPLSLRPGEVNEIRW